jgi:hypothetical protein
MFSISLLILILHRSPSFTGPFSFPKIYSLSILIVFVFPVVVVQAYDPQVSVVRVREVTCLMTETVSHVEDSIWTGCV